MASPPELDEAARLFTGWVERARLREIALRYFRYWAATFPDKRVEVAEGDPTLPLSRVWAEFWSHEFEFHAHARLTGPRIRTRLGLYGPEGMGAPLVGELVMDTRLDGVVCEAVRVSVGGEEMTYFGGLLTPEPDKAKFPKMLWPPAEGAAEPGAAPDPGRT